MPHVKKSFEDAAEVKWQGNVFIVLVVISPWIQV